MATVGRPLEFDPDKALRAAMDVFWDKGFEATSVNDLLQAMNLSKSSLYQTFGNKRMLFQRCLGYYGAGLHANMVRQLEEAGSGYQFIEALLNSIAQTAGGPEGARGCLMVNSTIEFGQEDPDIGACIAQNLQSYSDLFIEAVKRGQEEGDIAPDSDPQAVADYLHVAISGLRTMVKGGADRKSVQTTIGLVLKAIA